MTKHTDLLSKIEHLRNIMHGLIEENNELLNPEIVFVSQELDLLLNQLHHLSIQG